MRYFSLKPHTAIWSIAIFALITFALFMSLSSVTNAAPNYQINYQGKLTTTANVAVPNGTYNMRFWLLTTPTIATTSAVWTESLTTTNRVQVTNGLFSVMLGSTSPLTSVDFNQTLYLGVEIGSTTTSPLWDGEMSPRKILGTVPAAFEADRLDGFTSSQFVRTDTSSAIASTSASTLLTITQNGTGDILNLFDGSTEVFSIIDGGFIGIGSSTPSRLLTVNGDIYTANLTATGTITSASLLATNATSTTFRTGTLGVGSDYLTDITGTGLSITNGILNASDGVSDWRLGGAGYLIPTTTVGISVSASSTIGGGTGATGLTIAGTATTTNLKVTSLTASRGIFTGADGLFTTTGTSQYLIDALSDETGTGLSVFNNNPLLAGFRSNASSTIGGGTGATGLTIAGTATTTNLKVTSLTAARGIFTGADGLFTTTGTSQYLIDALSDETGTGLNVFNANPLLASFRSNASSTIGGGTGATGLTIAGGATTTGVAYFASNVGIGTKSPVNALDVVGKIGILGSDYNNMLELYRSNGNQSVLLGETVGGSGITSAFPLGSTSNAATLLSIGDGTLGPRWYTNASLNVQGSSPSHFSAGIGIGTTTTWAKLSIQDASGSLQPLFDIATTTGATPATSTVFRVAHTGFVGLGTSTPTALLALTQRTGQTSPLLRISSSTEGILFQIAADGSVDIDNGGFTYNAASNETTIEQLMLGAVNFETDAGVVSWVDMQSSSTPANNPLSYSAQIDGNPILTVYGTSNGSGGVQNLRVGIGTTSPWKTLSVSGDLSLTGAIFDTASSSGSKGMVLLSTGTSTIWTATSSLGLSSGGTADGVSDWRLGGAGYLIPTTTVGISVSASSTIGGGTGATGLTIAGTATTTNLKVTSLTAARGIFTGADGLFTTTGVSQYLIDSLSDETGTGALVFGTNPLLAGFRSNASSTIGGGTGATGLTVNGNATTTGSLIVQGTATSTFANDISLSNGCFRDSSGKCVGRGRDGTYIVAAYNSTNRAYADYQADGTGDETEINQAITAAYGNGRGGKVYLLEGDFTMSTSPGDKIVMATSTALIGAGDATRIRIADTSNVNINVIAATNTPSIMIADLLIEGNRGNNSSGNQFAIYLFNVSTSTIQNVTASGTRTYSIYLNGGSGYKVLNNTVINNTIRGISANAVSQSFFSNNILSGNGSNGIVVSGGGYNTITGNMVNRNGDIGMYIFGTNNNTITGNQASFNTNHGISLEGSDYNSVSGNLANSNSRGIFLTASADNNSVAGNIMISNGSWGMLLSSTCLSNSITGNIISSGSSVGLELNTSSARNTISDNTITSNTGAGIVFDTSVTENTITSNVIRSNGTYGISFLSGADNNIISSNRLSTNGGSTANSAINLANSDDNLISSNQITDSAGTGFAIMIDSSSARNILVGNTYSGQGASAINDTATGTTRYTQGDRITLNSLGSVAYSPFYISASSSGSSTIHVFQTGSGPLMSLFTATSGELFTITNSGRVGIGTTTPYTNLTVVGGFGLTGSLFDSTATSGTNGMVLLTTGAGTRWVATSSLGITGGAGTADGVSDWRLGGAGYLIPTTTVGISVSASSTIGGGTGATGLTIAGTATTTNLKVTSLTASRGIFTGADGLFTTTGTSQYLIDALSDETGTGLSVFNNNPLLAGFRSNASSTIGGGTGATGLTIAGGATTTGNAYFGGTVGIGTTSPTARLHLVGTAGPSDIFTISSSTNAQLLTVGASGFLGLGTSTPTALLALTQRTGQTSPLLRISSSTEGILFQIAADGSVDIDNGGFTYNAASNETTIEQLMLGAVNFETDAGVVSWVDMQSSSTPANEALSYSAQIDGRDVLTVYGTSNGSGGVQNLRVGIGTTSPWKTLSVSGDLSLTGAIFDTASSSGSKGMVLLSTGTSTIWTATSSLGITGGGGGTLDSLTDVDTSGVATGSILVYDGGSGLWVPRATTSIGFVSSGDGVSNWRLNTAGDALIATSTKGILALASSTIGGGTGASGLTIQGNSTTSLNAYIGGTLSLGSTTPSASLTVVGTGQRNLFQFASSTGSSLLTLDARGVLMFGTSTTDASILINGGPTSTRTHLIGYNIAIGNQAFSYPSTTATFLPAGNIALGRNALYGSSSVPMTGGANFAAGISALYNNTTGVSNAAIGSSALYANTTGAYNTALGNGVLSNNVSGSYNNGVGISSLYSNTTGSDNNAIGNGALFNNTTGSYNSALGYTALYGNTTGSNSAGLGYMAGFTSQTGSHNLFLGDEADSVSAGLSKSIAIGTHAKVARSNTLVLGGTGAWTADIVSGTSTAFAKLSIQNNYGSTTPLFDIATTTSSTYATSSLFRVAHDGRISIGSTTPESQTLTVQKTGITGATIAGIKEYLGFTNSTQSAIYYGDNAYIVNAPTATSTLVGKIIRIEDNSQLGNTVRGLEVQAHRGTTTKGENTGISGFGRTFGVRGTTEGDAGDTFIPAGVYAESRGTTQGNALRAYSGTITTSSLAYLFQDTSVFSGTGLLMNFGNAGGSFAPTSSAKFLDFQSGGTSKFTVTAAGTTTIGDGTTARMAGLQIGYGGICVDNDGSCNASTTGRITAVQYGTANSDLAEMYFSRENLLPGEIVALKGGLSITRAEDENTSMIVGVVSTKPGMTMGFDDKSLNSGEQPYPVALKGRVPVRLSTENGPIKKGDRITISSIEGVGMKATESSVVVGIALEDYDGELAYTEGFINQFGDDIARAKTQPLNQNMDTRTQDGCSYGAGNENGEAPCIKDAVKTIKPIVVTPPDFDTVLRELKKEKAATSTLPLSDEEVEIGQALMFVQLTDYIMPREQDILTLLSSTSTLENGNGEETLFDRIKALAEGFVDGVLTLAEVVADKFTAEEVQTEMLCIGDTCVDESTLKALLRAQGQDPAPEPDPEPEENEETPPEGGEENPGGDEGGGGEESTDDPEPEENEQIEPPAEDPETVPEEAPEETPPSEPAP